MTVPGRFRLSRVPVARPSIDSLHRSTRAAGKLPPPLRLCTSEVAPVAALDGDTLGLPVVSCAPPVRARIPWSALSGVGASASTPSGSGDREDEADHEEDLPAQQSSSGEEARLPHPDGDPIGPCGPPGASSPGPRSSVGLIDGIRDRATFAGFGRGHRASCGPLRLRFVRSVGTSAQSGHARVAYAINRKVGSAVVRNRIRRRLRAALVELDRVGPEALPNGAYLFSAAAGIAELPFSEVERLVACVVEQACGRG